MPLAGQFIAVVSGSARLVCFDAWPAFDQGATYMSLNKYVWDMGCAGLKKWSQGKFSTMLLASGSVAWIPFG